MSKEILVRVKLFGTFRSYGEYLDFTLQESSCVKDLKQAMKDKVEEKDFPILESSAFSDDKQILQEDSLLDGLNEVAILPPISGG
jgi:molybdopterin converting factor small subunit